MRCASLQEKYAVVAAELADWARARESLDSLLQNQAALLCDNQEMPKMCDSLRAMIVASDRAPPSPASPLESEALGRPEIPC
jgi:hypothetical protein